MTKLAFTMISNDPYNLNLFAWNLKHAMIPHWKHKIYIVAQPPLTLSLIENINWPSGLNVWARSIPPIVRPGKVRDVLSARRLFFDAILKDGDIDYIFWCDDDFRFADGTNSYLKASSADRIFDSCNYLDLNPSCGLVQHMTFFGGSAAKLNIVPVRKGYWETGIGFCLRGNDPPYIDNRFDFYGAGNDVALFLTKIMEGYYIARNYNNPTRKRATNKVFRGNHNRHYDLNYIEQEGLIAQVYSITGGRYRYGAEPPIEIKKLHRSAASLRGFDPFY